MVLQKGLLMLGFGQGLNASFLKQPQVIISLLFIQHSLLFIIFVAAMEVLVLMLPHFANNSRKSLQQVQ